jgi:hypothetical protein
MIRLGYRMYSLGQAWPILANYGQLGDQFICRVNRHYWVMAGLTLTFWCRFEPTLLESGYLREGQAYGAGYSRKGVYRSHYLKPSLIKELIVNLLF